MDPVSPPCPDGRTFQEFRRLGFRFSMVIPAAIKVVTLVLLTPRRTALSCVHWTPLPPGYGFGLLKCFISNGSVYMPNTTRGIDIREHENIASCHTNGTPWYVRGMLRVGCHLIQRPEGQSGIICYFSAENRYWGCFGITSVIILFNMPMNSDGTLRVACC